MTDSPTLGTARAVLRHARWDQWRHLLVASLMTMANQAGEVLTPIVIGVLVDRAMVTGDVAALARWTAVLVAVHLTQSLSYRFGQRRTHRGAVSVEQGLRLAVLHRIVAPTGGAEHGRLPGDLTAVATQDVWQIAFVNYLIPHGAAALAAVAVGGGALLALSLPVGIVALAGAPPLLLLVHLMGRPLQTRHAAQQGRAAEASGVAVDLVRGIRVLKGLGAEPQAQERYRLVSRRSSAAALVLGRADAAHQGLVVALNGLYLVAVGAVGVTQASRGHLSAGQLVAVVGVAQFLLGPMARIADLSAASAAARAAAGRVADVLSAPAAVSSGSDAPPPPGAGHLRFRGVTAGPLDALDLTIAAGETVGIVADDPAVAAVLVRCLSRERDPDHGTVELDGVSLTDLSPDRGRERILAVVHEAALFDDSLRATLTSLDGAPDAVDASVRAACLEDVIAALPGGLDAPVGERGRALSGGQRQRVALARALSARPTILVLHDPTTAVDVATEQRIAEGLAAVRRDATTVLVTTSPALLQATDRVVLLAGGRVVEGTHGDLLATASYRDLVLA